MSAAEFLDTSVLVYAYDRRDPRKQGIAQGLVHRALDGEIAASGQVLGEFASTLLHKLIPPVRPPDLAALLHALESISLVPLDHSVIIRAVKAHEQYGLHFYDGLIVASAERGGCKKIWSEDLHAGQEYFGVKVENPFAP